MPVSLTYKKLRNDRMPCRGEADAGDPELQET